MSEWALLLVKPDAVERDLTSEVFRRVRKRGCRSSSCGR
ncbi:nucleoside-diphosphate kinase [Halorarius halobius]|nr:nucleoside-diphosphate kinase [Halorarius halobius]